MERRRSGRFVEAASSRFGQGMDILHAEAAGCRFYGACARGNVLGRGRLISETSQEFAILSTTRPSP